MIGFFGRYFLGFIGYLGELALLAAEVLVSLVRARIRWRLFFTQVVEMGFRSQLVVAVTGAFTGAVFAAQTYFQFHRLQMDSAVGTLVALAMFRELGPVLTGLMVSGRVGAAIAAEIGTMKVTEQIDALRALGVHPIDFLVVPRVLALLLSMPLLVAECVGLGIVAAYVVTTKILGVPEVYFIHHIVKSTSLKDLEIALTKGFAFAVVIAFVACYEGLNAKEGAVGVGRAPTQAVVAASLAILIANFFLSFGLNIVFPS